MMLNLKSLKFGILPDCEDKTSGVGSGMTVLDKEGFETWTPFQKER
jgi:hypothetical protein